MRRPYYLFSNGRLRRRHNTLYLERADAERSPGADAEDTGLPSGRPTGEKVPFPVEQVEALYCFGEIDVNAKLVTFLAQHAIPLFFFDYYGNYTATLYPRDYLHSGRLKVQQVRHYLNRRRRLVLARAFVEAATYNILRVLKYYAPRLEGAAAEAVQTTCDVIAAERSGLDETGEIAELMGREGRCREAYYRTWPHLLGEAGLPLPAAGAPAALERAQRPHLLRQRALLQRGAAADLPHGARPDDLLPA